MVASEGVGIAREVEPGEVVAEAVAPEAERAGGLVGLEPLLLPEGEVGELDGQLRQHGRGAADFSLVEGDHVAHQHAERDAVADDVVHADEQGVVIGVEAQQLEDEQRAVLEIEAEGGVRTG